MDNYTIGQILGQGHFGITYLCTEIATGQQYACKRVLKHNLVLEEEREMLQREIRILRLISHLDHPNIVSIKDILEDDTSVNIVMELCEGGELYDDILECGALEEPEAARVIKEVVYAIEVCHNLGIAHRDLKLENVLFKTKDKDSVVKIIDFGFAKVFEIDEVLTDIVGSSAYVAPEVMEGDHGPKADIWSAGVILYVLLVRFFPFKDGSMILTYKDVMKKNELFTKDPWPSISKGAKDLIQKMLTHDVNKRLSASEVLMHPWIQENVK